MNNPLRDALLPCPFCGTRCLQWQAFKNMPYSSDRVVIGCLSPCGFQQAFFGDSIEEAEQKAKEWWNTRAALAQPDPLRDALELILPLAKGYVANNQVGSNQAYIEAAEAALAQSSAPAWVGVDWAKPGSDVAFLGIPVEVDSTMPPDAARIVQTPPAQTAADVAKQIMQASITMHDGPSNPALESIIQTALDAVKAEGRAELEEHLAEKIDDLVETRAERNKAEERAEKAEAALEALEIARFKLGCIAAQAKHETSGYARATQINAEPALAQIDAALASKGGK